MKGATIRIKPPAKPFAITPAKKGSGKRDISLRHDEYLARKTRPSPRSTP